MTPSQDNVPNSSPGSIADPFWDLLAPLDYGKRQGLVRRLAVGFYEGWEPSRAEVALLVDFEMGRITEEEFMTAAPRPAGMFPAQSDTDRPNDQGTAGARPARGQRTDGADPDRSPGKPSRVANFNVDCGEVAPPFRMIVRGLTTDGWTVRARQRYLLLSLHYVLLPPRGLSGRRGQSITPMLYTAPIACVPDVTAPWADSDGRRRHHWVRSGHIAGSRGPWPLAHGVRGIQFLLAEQQPAGSLTPPRPAGVLRVDIARSAAIWSPIPDRISSDRSRAAEQ